MSESPNQSAPLRPPVIALVHFALNTKQINGVIVQAERLGKAFCDLGWQLRTVAGSGDVSHLIPGLHREDLVPDAPALQYDHLRSALDGVDLVWVINLCTTPYNRRAADLLVDAVTQLHLPTIFNHHDLAEDHDFDFYLPVRRDLPWHTVITHRISPEQLGGKSTTQHNLGPSFHTPAEALDRSVIFKALGLEPSHRLFAQPTRFHPRKNVLGALQCALDLHLQDPARPVTFWIMGAPDVRAKGRYLTDFFSLAQKCENLGMTVRWGDYSGLDCRSVDAAYAAADLIFYPPHNGNSFGLPPIEAALHLIPVAVGRDPHVEAVRANAGLNYLPLDATAIDEWFSLPEPVRDGQLRLNRLRATTRFSFPNFAQTIGQLLRDCDLDHLVDAGESCIPLTAASEMFANHNRPLMLPSPLDLQSPRSVKSPWALALQSPCALALQSPSALALQSPRSMGNNLERIQFHHRPGGVPEGGLAVPASPFGMPLLSPISPIQLMC